MAKNEKTSSPVTKIASSVLRDSSASKAAKSLAGSALSQFRTTKQSSATTAHTAANALNDGRTSPAPKTLAGSVLTQKSKKSR
ncbi:hypothetical protein DFR29_12148 [Tahibacter aquaticus]|uniref:Uncharacterized protein n=1 Tax=Tahibacter aquaticus TaxID=520092 RepID=A0A4V3DLA1_9GAMM|nr:hypothetical protein DFR29_12148 [Tahibacter aquaticus]